MKRVFRMLAFVSIMAVTPMAFTSCGNLIGMFEDLLENLEEEDGDEEDYGYNDGYYDDEDNSSDMPVEKENEMIEIDSYGFTDRNFLELCVNLTHEYKYDIIGLEDCDWVRIKWVSDYEMQKWTPLLTVDENMTGESRLVDISIYLGDNHICHHTIYQHP